MTKLLRPEMVVVKSGEIVAVDARQLPATKKQPNGFKRFRILGEIADRIVEEHERLWRVRRSLLHRRDEPPPDLEDAQLSECTKNNIARYRALLKEIDRDDRYEEDEAADRVLKKPIIAQRLALMIANARVGAKSSGDSDGSAEMLVAHVFDAEPDYLAFEDACRDIEATQKFVPATAEVLEKINEHDGRWRSRRNSIATIESMARELQNEIREAQAKFEAEEAAAKTKRAEVDLRNLKGLVGQAKQQAIAKQESIRNKHESIRKEYQELEAAMARLVKYEADLDAARAALAEAF